MKYRTLGRTGIQVSEIGYGAWGIGEGMWKGAEDGESFRALHRSVDLGLNFIDTAIVYGDGHSEELVGRFVKERKERITIASKIPPKNQRWPARQGTPLREAFPYDHIISSTEASLRNLKLDSIDIQQFHVWSDEWSDQTEWQEAIAKLKEEGKIRHFGISINDHEPSNALKLCAAGKVDTVQVIYNIFDQSPESALFPLCLEKGVGVIVRVPLDEGGLTGEIKGETLFAPGDFRNNYFRGERKKLVEERVAKLTPLLGKEALTLPELALRFTLSHDAVSTVIPGMRSVAHAESNALISDGRKLSPELIQRLRTHRWDRNYYQRDPVSSKKP